MLKKLIVPAFLVSLVGGSLAGCIVQSRRGGCGHAYRWNGNRCVRTVPVKKNKPHKVETRDHRR